MKTSDSPPKKLWRVTMNWQREVHVFYRHATSASKAAQIAYLALAEKLGFREVHRIRAYFMCSDVDNIRVEEVKKDGKLSNP